jgi:hypothetical protein
VADSPPFETPWKSRSRKLALLTFESTIRRSQVLVSALHDK